MSKIIALSLLMTVKSDPFEGLGGECLVECLLASHVRFLKEHSGGVFWLLWVFVLLFSNLLLIRLKKK